MLAHLCARLLSNGCASTSLPEAVKAFTSSAVVNRIRMAALPVERPESLSGPGLPEGGEPAAEDPMNTVKPDLVQQFLNPNLMSASELLKLKLQETLADFQRFEGDTGSSEVQVALLTERIKAMAEHMKVHRKDFHSRRGLEGMLTQRRKLLQYLRRSDFEAYTVVLVRLGLKDNYAKEDRLTMMLKSSTSGAKPKSKSRR